MFLCALLLVAAQAASPETTRAATFGPAIGQALPAFEAVDSEGARRTFESLRGPNGLVLVFFRSVDW